MSIKEDDGSVSRTALTSSDLLQLERRMLDLLSGENLRITILAFVTARKNWPDNHRYWNFLVKHIKSLITEQNNRRADEREENKSETALFFKQLDNVALELWILAFTEAHQKIELPQGHKDLELIQSVLAIAQSEYKNRELPDDGRMEVILW